MMSSLIKKAVIGTITMLASSYSMATSTPEWVTIEDVQYNGSGCPIGSVAENLFSQPPHLTIVPTRS